MNMENTLERNRLIIEIMALAYLVHTETDYCVFIDFAGHVDQIDVSIRESKENWQKRILETDFYAKYNELYKYQDDGFLKAKRDLLLQILSEKNIPYDELDYQTEEIRKYTF